MVVGIAAADPVACKKEDRAHAIPDAAALAPLPSMVVSASRTDLVFAYVDPLTNKLVTTSSIAEIPEAARAQVIVTDLSLSPEQRQADRVIFVADLSRPNAEGVYSVSIASRFGFEVSPTIGTEGDSARNEGVVLYTTSWCGVCRKVKSLLSSWNVSFVERDIEASKSARDELEQKARAAGVTPQGVPVIDVAGVMLLGLDEAKLRSTLKAKGFVLH